MTHEPHEAGLARDPTLVRRINRALVLDYLRLHGPAGRAELARELQISLPTVVNIIEELEAERFVRREGSGRSSGGRPSPLYAFDHGSHAVIGVDVGGSKMHGAVTDLAGGVQYELTLPNDGVKGRQAVGRLIGLIERLLAAPRPPEQTVLGIGIGAPGVVTHPQGLVVWAPGLSWRELPLKDLLAQHFPFPVAVENDVNLAALGELNYGAGRGARNLVLIRVGTGIGAGIVINGALYRGSHRSAGEVGCLLPNPQCLRRRFDRFGALESLASAAGMAKRSRRLLRRQGLPVPADLDARQICAAAREGQDWAKRLVAETADYLSLALVNLALILDPEVIVFSGGLSRSADLFLPAMTAALNSLPFPPALQLSTLGDRASALGAVSLVLDTVIGRPAAYSEPDPAKE